MSIALTPHEDPFSWAYASTSSTSTATVAHRIDEYYRHHGLRVNLSVMRASYQLPVQWALFETS